MSFAEFLYTEILKPKPLKALANAILFRIIHETVKIGNATVCINPNDPVVSGALTLGVFEQSELDFFQRYCRGDMVFVDIGANVGLYTALSMHLLSPLSRIIAIEPHPESFSYLQKTIAANNAQRENAPKTVALCMAASSKFGTVRLFLNPENKGDNRSYNTQEKNWNNIEVKTQPVDSLLDSLKIEQVNFIKMDVQGFEHNVLRGIIKKLHQSRHVILMTEFWPKGLREADGEAIQYLQDLTNLGFTLYELKEKPRGKIVPLEHWDQLIARLPGRKYTTIIGVKGYRCSFTCI